MGRFSRAGFAILVALLAGTASLPAARAQSHDQLTLGQLQFIPSMHPLMDINNTKLWVLGFVQRPITAYDDKGQSTCVLCAEMPSLDNGLAKIVDLPGGKKGMEVTIKLRPDVKWGDGQPVSAQDILFTWQIAKDGVVGFSNYNAWTRATQVDVLDPKTVVLHLPSVMVGYDAWDQVLPSHLEQPIYEKNKGSAQDYLHQSLYNSDPTNPGLWDGAYTIFSIQLGAQIVMTANPGWPVKPDIARMVVTYRDQTSALVQNLLSHDIDVTTVNPGGISLPQMLSIKREQGDKFTIPISPGTILERIAFQLDNPILKDVRVRQAIAAAIDRQAISTKLFQGLQPVAESILTPASAYYTKDVAPNAYDPAKAKQLLAQAGWKPGPDGVLVDARGTRLALDLVTTAGNQTRIQIAQVIQSELQAVGIALHVDALPIGTYNTEQLRKRTFAGLALSSIQFPPSTSPRFYLGTEGIPTQVNGWIGNNFSGYSNPNMDAAVTESEDAIDPAQVKDGWIKIQQGVASELPYLPLYFYANSYVMAKGVNGIDVGTVDQPTNWAEQWSWH